MIQQEENGILSALRDAHWREQAKLEDRASAAGFWRFMAVAGWITAVVGWTWLIWKENQ
jgi:hypothetical protein